MKDIRGVRSRSLRNVQQNGIRYVGGYRERNAMKDKGKGRRKAGVPPKHDVAVTPVGGGREIKITG